VTQTAGGAVPTKSLMGWVPMGPEDRYPELALWDAVIGRIAADIDMPKEMLTGLGDTSHWTSWLLQEDGFNAHVGPVLQRFCADIAGAYLRPAAIDAGIPNAENAMIGADVAKAVAHPDKTGTALKAHEPVARLGRVDARADRRPRVGGAAGRTCAQGRDPVARVPLRPRSRGRRRARRPRRRAAPATTSRRGRRRATSRTASRRRARPLPAARRRSRSRT
jgi:hypothetical protein